MEVVLTKDVPKLGFKHDIVRVKDGFFRNFLFPRGFAAIVTPGRRKDALSQQSKRLLRRQEISANAEKLLETFRGLVLVFKKKATSKGKLYGSIGEDHILEQLEKEAKIHLEKENLEMPQHIKELGEFEIPVRLTDDVKGVLKVRIEKQE
ncbi:50S ribosomal protein L9 [Candidatus Peregrinibacteria bacterium]|nr:50S ribosomal protein L9 [Candidatus Peregrinibacteria bacterium]